jgi:multiple sugar transport system permease protein
MAMEQVQINANPIKSGENGGGKKGGAGENYGKPGGNQTKQQQKIGGFSFKRFLRRFKHAAVYEKILFSLFLLVLFAGVGYVLIYPVIYMVTTAIKTPADMLDTTTIWIAKEPTLQNFADAFGFMDYPRAVISTLIIAVGATVLNLFVCSAIGYAFARLKFKERNLIFALVILTLIIPPQVLSLPQYISYSRFDILGIFQAVLGGTLNFHGSYAPFLLPALFGLGLKSGLFIFIFRQFYRGMPVELEEAGYIDGCGTIRTYFSIMMPNAVPSFVTVALLSFVWRWNDVFEPSMYLANAPAGSIASPTLAMKLVNITGIITKGSQMTDLSYVIPTKYAGVTLAIIPLIVIYLIGQRYFVESIERSGIVG